MAPKWVRVCASVLLFLFPASMLASDVVGTLTSKGAVTIEGRQAPASSAVFATDQIRTGESAQAVITARGMVMTLAPNSVMSMGTGSVELGSGAVVISTSNNAITVNGTRIAALGEIASRFLVKRVNDDLKVVALAGEIAIGEAPQQTPVPATKGVSIPSSGKKRSKGAGMSWLSNPDIGILIVVAAAITAGVTLGIVNSRNSSSPAAP